MSGQSAAGGEWRVEATAEAAESGVLKQPPRRTTSAWTCLSDRADSRLNTGSVSLETIGSRCWRRTLPGSFDNC